MRREFRLGEWLVQPELNAISRNGNAVHLEPKVMEVLLRLADQPGEVISREQLFREVWPDTFVNDDALKRCISELRTALDDDAYKPRYIQTVPKRGYRLIAPLKQAEEPPPHPKTRKMAAIALTIIAAAAIGYLAYLTSSGSSPPPIRSIAVLPLKNLSPDPGQEYFVEGMHEALIRELSKIGALTVISRTSTMSYKDTDKSVPQIAKELNNADAIVEGSVSRSGDRVRITVHLIHAPSDRHLWAQSFDREVGGVMALQQQVAEAIANEMRVKITGEERSQLARAVYVDPEAYEFYLRGQFHLNRWAPEGTEKGIELLEKAVKQDPQFALGHATLADAYMTFPWLDYDSRTQKAKAAASRAIALDQRLAEAHSVLGWVIFNHDWDWAEAEKHFKKAVGLNPNSSASHDRYARYLVMMRRFDSALTEAKEAHRLDPISPRFLEIQGSVLYYLGEYDKALASWQEAAQLSPNSQTNVYQGFVFLKKGMLEEAARVAAAGEQRVGHEPATLGIVGYLYGRAGRAVDAQRILRSLRKISQRSPVAPAILAWVHAGLGQHDQAFATLEEAYQQRDSTLTGLQLWPVFDPLRGDPRYAAFVRRMNFPQ